MRARNLLSSQGVYGGIHDSDIFFNGPSAGAHGADDAAIVEHGDATTKNHNFALVTLLDAIERPAGLRHIREQRCGLVKDAGSKRLVDGQIDAANQSSVLSYESEKVSARIHDGHVVSDAKA